MKQYRVYITVESFDEDGIEVDMHDDICIARFDNFLDALDFASTIGREAEEWRRMPKYKEKLI